MVNYRFPEGVEFLGESAGRAQMTVTIPTDDEGFFGRECPACKQHFRIAADDYESLPDGQMLWCVYCGHQADSSDFTTAQQMVRLRRAAVDYGVQMASRMLGEAFRDLARGSPNSLVRISHRPTPFHPKPLPGIDEERLVRERACPGCGLRYAVFAEHRYCPVCGQLPALATALDSLAAETARIDVLTDNPPQKQAELQESGVLDRTYVDTIENAVGIVETLTERAFIDRVERADQILRGRGQVFQRLDELADLFDTHLGIDLRANLGPGWAALQRAWAARHVFTHCDGIVDTKYLAAVPDSPLLEGQRLVVTEDMARTVLRDAELLCRALWPATDPAAPRELVHQGCRQRSEPDLRPA